MNPGRLDNGEKIAAVSAVLLFIFMFLDWFGVKVDQGNLLSLLIVRGGGNAWQTLEAIPIFLMLAIVVAVGAALMRTTGSNWKPVVPPSAAVTVLGGLAVLLILIRIVFPPGFSGSVGNGKSIEPTLEAGVFLALAAACGITFGGYLTMRQESLSFTNLRGGDAADRSGATD